MSRFIQIKRKMGRNDINSVPLIINLDHIKAVAREEDGTSTFWIDGEKILSTVKFEQIADYLDKVSAKAEDKNERANSQSN